MTKKLTSTALASLSLLASMAAHAQSASKVYIVQLRDEPIASYQGTTSGYAATQAAAGTQLNARTSAAVAWSNFLRTKQQAVLSTIGQFLSDNQRGALRVVDIVRARTAQ